MSKKLSDQFITIYNEIEAVMRSCSNSGDRETHTDLIWDIYKQNKISINQREDLLLFAKLRNSITHSKYKRDFDPIAEPHEEIVKRYEELKNNIQNPPKALSIAVKNIYSVGVNDNIVEIINTMTSKTYTHIPILDEDGGVIGIFSENVLLCYLSENDGIIIDKDTTVKEFENFIEADKHKSEFFKFVDRNTLLSEVKKIFEQDLKAGKRLAVVYITEHGKENEKPIGMITAWDLAGK